METWEKHMLISKLRKLLPTLRHMYLPRERHHMVFAKTEHIYIPHNHHFIVIFLENSIVYHIYRECMLESVT